MSTDSKPPLRLHILAVAMLFLISVVGVFVSGFLTFLKFRSTYSCDVSLLSACQIGELFSCESVLTSSWSTFPRDVPISIYGTSFYAVLIALSWLILYREERYKDPGRAIVVGLTVTALAVCIPLSIYAAILGLCSYCLILYLLNISLVLLADLMSPQGLLQAIKKPFAWPRNRNRHAAIIAVSCLGFLALTLVQVVVYLRSAQQMAVDSQCVDIRGQQPATRLVTSAEDPEAEISLFVDLSCPACRKEFANWKTYIAESEGRYRLKIYHFPRGGKCATGRALNGASLLNLSCQAALAVECIDELKPGLGLGMQMMDQLFPLQDVTDGDAYFKMSRLVTAAKQLGLEVDESNQEDPFHYCIVHGRTPDETDALGHTREGTDVLSRVKLHVEFAERQGLSATPAAIITHFYGGDPLPYTVLVKGTKNYEDVHRFLRNAREEALVKYNR